MISIGRKSIMITTQTWLKLVKNCLKLIDVGLSLYRLKSWYA
jgi:hypothetical protein